MAHSHSLHKKLPLGTVRHFLAVLFQAAEMSQLIFEHVSF